MLDPETVAAEPLTLESLASVVASQEETIAALKCVVRSLELSATGSCTL